MNINDPLERDSEESEESEASESESSKASPGFPDVSDCYFGFYAEFLPKGDGAQKTVSGADCYIGSELQIERRGSGKDSHLVLIARNGISLGPVPHRVNARLERLLDNGWEVKSLLSLVTYTQDDKKFYAEAAFMCFAPDMSHKVQGAMEEYARQQTKRIKGGDHPSLVLSQENFERVVSSNGGWYMTPRAELTKKQKNRMSYKSHQSLSDRLVDMSTVHEKGCAVLAVIFMALLFLAAGFIIWLIFYR